MVSRAGKGLGDLGNADLHRVTTSRLSGQEEASHCSRKGVVWDSSCVEPFQVWPEIYLGHEKRRMAMSNLFFCQICYVPIEA